MQIEERPTAFTPPFHRWLKQRRNELNLTQADLARRIAYSPETIRKIEAGVLKPSKQIADLLAGQLELLPEQHSAFVAFATGTGAPKPQARPTHLPQPLTTLVGRETDVSAVGKLFKRADTRLISLIGPPGVGKTRLAIEVAQVIHASGAFADGVWFVALAPITESAVVLSTLAHALGIQEKLGQPMLLTVQQFLRERELLLVLDNFEQVLEAVPLVAQLLAGAPRLKALVTSREPLHMSGEQRYEVSPLALDGVAETLFVQRAKAVKPDFDTAETQLVLVTEICRRLDGLPLAIELAAARIVLFTPKELLARLSQRLPVLTDGSRDAPARQRTLRATLDWSYELLTPEEQALFRRLGVFAGGCTLQAVQRFCEHDVLNLRPIEGIAALVSKSLMARRVDPNGESRYYMLETMREYALDKLAALGEQDIWLRRLAEYMVDVLIKLQDPSVPEDEIENWRVAIAWSLSAPRSGRLAKDLALLAPSELGMTARELSDWLEAALVHAPDLAAPAEQAHFMFRCGDAHRILSEFGRARQLTEQSLAICREYHLQEQIPEILSRLGNMAREQDDISAARAYLTEGIQLAQALEDKRGLADMLNTLAEVEIMADELAQAQHLLDEALLRCDKDDHMMQGWILNHHIHLSMAQSAWPSAISFAEQSIKEFNAVPFYVPRMWGLAWGYQSLGEIALGQGNPSAAKTHFEASLYRFNEIGDQMGIAWCLAGAAALDEEPERGATLWGAGEALSEKLGCRIAPASRYNRERTVALLRTQLGEAEFERLIIEGRGLTMDEAIALALA